MFIMLQRDVKNMMCAFIGTVKGSEKLICNSFQNIVYRSDCFRITNKLPVCLIKIVNVGCCRNFNSSYTSCRKSSFSRWKLVCKIRNILNYNIGLSFNCLFMTVYISELFIQKYWVKKYIFQRIWKNVTYF